MSGNGHQHVHEYVSGRGLVLLLGGVLVLAVGTYLFRLAGPALRDRLGFTPAVERLLETAAVVLLAALVAGTALSEGHGFCGFARPSGVLVGGVLAWRRVPFVVVVLAAAGVTAALRALGVQ